MGDILDTNKVDIGNSPNSPSSAESGDRAPRVATPNPLSVANPPAIVPKLDVPKASRAKINTRKSPPPKPPEGRKLSRSKHRPRRRSRRGRPHRREPILPIHEAGRQRRVPYAAHRTLANGLGPRLSTPQDERVATNRPIVDI